MHLISEKKLIYAVLVLTVVFFIALLALPVVTHENGVFRIEDLNLDGDTNDPGEVTLFFDETVPVTGTSPI